MHKIYVDAGCIWVGDPCYIMGDDASNRVHDWQEFCSKLDYTKQAQSPLGEGIGLCIDSGYGDGCYPVDIETDRLTGRVKSVTITFIDRDEYYDDDDDNSDY